MNKKNIASWAMYDFANNAFPTLVITFVYSTYFEKVITPEGATSKWALATGIAAVFIGFLSPIFGALSDLSGNKKKFLFVSTILCVGFTCLLYFPRPGDVVLALTIVVLANVAFEISNVFYNGLLPEIAPKKDMGKISGIGFGVAFIGGLLCLFSVLVLFFKPDEGPTFFGLVPEELKVPSMNWFVGAWYLIFSLPLFFFLKLPKKKVKKSDPDQKLPQVVKQTFVELGRTLKVIRKDYRQVFRLLLARLFYNDGLVAIFAFGAIYATQVFDFQGSDILVFGIVLNVAACVGAIGFGFLEDIIGSKRTIMFTLIAFIFVTLLAVFAPTATWFWVAAVMVGILNGPNQSASRSLMAKFIPPNKENEFFGFFAFSGKATAFLAPMTWWLMLEATNENYRAALASVVVFFGLGIFLLTSVNESKGIEDSQKEYRHDELV